MVIDAKAKEILKKLIEKGYEAYIVGGYVRDKLLGLEAYDIDITTSATPDEIKEIFNVVDNGGKYQSLTIEEGAYSFEITTFRKDISYDDHRHPQTAIAKTLDEDLVRRDFTINAMAVDVNGNIIDKHNGLDDIKNKVIRCIGDPLKRFDEDSLRMLRAIYLTSKLGFEIEKNTMDAIYEKAALVKDLSGMRKRIELFKMIKYNTNNSYIDVLIKSRIVDAYKPIKKALYFLYNNEIVTNDIILVLALGARLNKGIDYSLEYDNETKALLKEMLSVDPTDDITYMDKSFEAIRLSNEVNRILGREHKDNIDEYYKSLPIKGIKGIDVTSYDLMEQIEPEMISDMKQRIMNAILKGKIKNSKDDIMKYVLEEKKKMDEVIKSVIYAKIDQIMNSDSMVNLIVTLDDKTRYNLKLECERAVDLFLNCIYEFEIARNTNSDKLSAYVVSFKHITEVEDTEKQNAIYRKFMSSAVLDYTELKNGIDGYIDSIKTKSLHDITRSIIDRYSNDFYLYPAAAKLHHAYVGGLAYHTLGMLDVAKRMIECYPYLDHDLLISGTILHDIGKVIEFTGVENTEYAMKGQLLGHLLIGCDIISQTAKELGYTGDEEEVLMLLHMVASHHGIPQYGAIKKPCIAESAMLWFIDSIDSKFRVLGDELAKTKDGEFTEPIGVMDRVKFYKHK